MRNRVKGLLQSYIDNGQIPGARLYVVDGGGFVLDETVGHRSLYPEVLALEKDTVFDLASLTKVVVTTPLLLQLIGDGQLSLQDKVSRFVPEFSGGEKQHVTVEHLLTHSSGLPAHRAYHKHFGSKAEIEEAVIRESLIHSPGERVTYSDLGFILAGHLIERINGKLLQDVAQQRLFQPMGMIETSFTPYFSECCFAATEGGKRGVVHDENAEAMGGVAGHAGLFSTMRDLVAFATMWNNDGWYNEQQIIPTAMVHDAVKERVIGRGLGWEIDEYGYGHTGFTGTSARFEKDWMAILLTNRVHLGRDTPIGELRKKLHQELRMHLL